jgi:excisionase family DNA binding protein
MNNPFETLDARLSNIENLLLDLKHSNHGYLSTEVEELLTVQQAADFLSLSVQTIYGAIHRKQLPFMKRAKRCYFLKKDLIDYLKAGRKKTSAEIESEAEKFINDRKGLSK